MPVNKRWPVEELLAACRAYFEKTGRRVSFEYTMIDGVSDAPEQAELLAKKLHGMQAHVNMIPLNNVEESGLRCSSHAAIERFQKILESHGVTATVRIVDSIEIQQKKDLLYLNFHGTGFLQNMVRILTGTLLEVGFGKRSVESVRDVLDAKDRTRRACAGWRQPFYLLQHKADPLVP